MKGLHHVGITVEGSRCVDPLLPRPTRTSSLSNEPSPSLMRRSLVQPLGVPGAALRQVSLRPRRNHTRAPGVQESSSRRRDRSGQTNVGASHVAISSTTFTRQRRAFEAKGIEFYSDVNVVRRRGSRRVEVGVLPGSGWLPARARRGCLLQRSGAARWHRDLSRVAVIASAGRGRRPPSPTTRPDKQRLSDRSRDAENARFTQFRNPPNSVGER